MLQHANIILFSTCHLSPLCYLKEGVSSRLSSCSSQIIHVDALLDHRAQRWTPGCFQPRYGLITGVADVEVQQPWHCPSACDERVALLPSQRKGDGWWGGVSLNAPLTPQNEIDRFTEVIAPSTIFFGRKYCYRQIGDSISRRRWGSRLWSKGCVCVSSAVEVAVSPDALSLMPGLFSSAQPSLFVSKPYFFPMSVLSAAFTFHILLPHHALPHSIRLFTAFLATFLQGLFSPFSSVYYVCLKGETPFSHTQQPPLPAYFSDCSSAAIVLVQCWYYLKILLIWRGMKK